MNDEGCVKIIIKCINNFCGEKKQQMKNSLYSLSKQINYVKRLSETIDEWSDVNIGHWTIYQYYCTFDSTHSTHSLALIEGSCDFDRTILMIKDMLFEYEIDIYLHVVASSHDRCEIWKINPSTSTVMLQSCWIMMKNLKHDRV